MRQRLDAESCDEHVRAYSAWLRVDAHVWTNYEQVHDDPDAPPDYIVLGFSPEGGDRAGQPVLQVLAGPSKGRVVRTMAAFLIPAPYCVAHSPGFNDWWEANAARYQPDQPEDTDD